MRVLAGFSEIVASYRAHELDNSQLANACDISSRPCKRGQRRGSRLQSGLIASDGVPQDQDMPGDWLKTGKCEMNLTQRALSAW